MKSQIIKYIKSGKVMDIPIKGKSSKKGWKLSILGKSIKDSEYLIMRLFDFLMKNEIAHKWGTSKRINHKHPIQSKKILTIYVPDSENHLKLAEKIYTLIKDYKGWYDIKTPKLYQHYAGGVFFRNDRTESGEYIKSFESNSYATINTVKGMGPVTLPDGTSKGSGDIPFLLPLGSELILRTDIDKIKKMIKDFNQFINESSDTYFKTFTAAADYARKEAEKRGFEIDEDDWQDQIALGGRYNRSRPSEGETHKWTIGLLKKGKPNKKALHIQVYGMKDKYELNFYIL